MKKRVKIPHKTEVKILVKNKHTCCICHDFKNYQEPIIHHIDGNPSNNKEDNLAVLCLNHASVADAGLRKGKLGSGKKLMPDEVRSFKADWEGKVMAEIKTERRILPVRERKQLEILYKFEISKRKNEILSLPREEQKTRRNNYEFLQELVFEEYTKNLKMRPLILDAFGDIALQSLNQSFIQIPLIGAISGLFLHLVGPEHVKIYSDDKKLLLQSLDVLKTVGSFEADLSDNTNVLKRVCKKVYELAETASWYKFNKFLDKAERTLDSIKKDCFSYKSTSKSKKKKQIFEEKLKIMDDAIQSIKKLK